MNTSAAIPEDIGLLDWNRPARDLRILPWQPSVESSMHRRGVPKLWLGECMAAVRSLDVGSTRSTRPAGTLVCATAQSLHIATADRDVALSDFLTLDGSVLLVADLLRNARLRAGMVLPAYPSASARAATAHACDRQDEAQWMDELRRVKGAYPPLQHTGSKDGTVASCVVLPGFEGRLPEPVDAAHFALAVVLAWLARSSGAEAFDIGMMCDRPDLLPGAYSLLARTRPFSVCARFGEPFGSFRRRCRTDVAAWEKRRPYLRDAVLRHTQLTRPLGWTDFAAWPMAVMMPAAANAQRTPAEPRAALTFAIDAAGAVTLWHRHVPQSQLNRAARQLATLAEDGLARPGVPLGELTLLSQDEAASLRTEVWGPQVRC